MNTLKNSKQGFCSGVTSPERTLFSKDGSIPSDRNELIKTLKGCCNYGTIASKKLHTYRVQYQV